MGRPTRREAVQPSESQLRSETRPTGLPEAGGFAAGVPRPQSLPEPDVRPDVQDGTRQPGVAVSSPKLLGQGR